MNVKKCKTCHLKHIYRLYQREKWKADAINQELPERHYKPSKYGELRTSGCKKVTRSRYF